MKALLIIGILLWLLVAYIWHKLRGTDDFGAAFLAFIVIGVAGACTLAYLSLAIWNHRVW